MQQIIMDSSQLGLSHTYAHLGELLDELQKFIPEGRIISQLFLDEQDVLDQRPESLREQVLEPVDTVRVVTSSLAQQVSSNLDELLVFMKELRPELRQASRELRYGSISEATSKLADVFQGLETVVRLVEELSGMLPLVNAPFSETELKSFSEKEGELLVALIEHFKIKEWALLADMLEFQLDPVLGRWQSILNRVAVQLRSSLDLKN